MSDITFVSQNNNGIWNDCGPAVFCMACNGHRGTKFRIEDVARDVQNEPNGLTSIARLVRALNDYHVPTPEPKYRDKAWIKDRLAGGYLVILLTNQTTTGYKTPHFVLVYGRPEFGIVPVYDPYRDDGPVHFSLDTVFSWVIGPVITPSAPLMSPDKARILELVGRL